MHVRTLARGPVQAIYTGMKAQMYEDAITMNYPSTCERSGRAYIDMAMAGRMNDTIAIRHALETVAINACDKPTMVAFGHAAKEHAPDAEWSVAFRERARRELRRRKT